MVAASSQNLGRVPGAPLRSEGWCAPAPTPSAASARVFLVVVLGHGDTARLCALERTCPGAETVLLGVPVCMHVHRCVPSGGVCVSVYIPAVQEADRRWPWQCGHVSMETDAGLKTTQHLSREVFCIRRNLSFRTWGRTFVAERGLEVTQVSYLSVGASETPTRFSRSISQIRENRSKTGLCLRCKSHNTQLTHWKHVVQWFLV